MRFENAGVRLLPDPAILAKNQTLDFLLEPIFIPKIATASSIAADDLWCPVRVLRIYLKRTQPLRGETTSLFVSINSPHNSVSRETISRWIVLVITSCEQAVLEGERASAHQVRAISSLIALFAGVPIAEILAAAVLENSDDFCVYLSKRYGCKFRSVWRGSNGPTQLFYGHLGNDNQNTQDKKIVTESSGLKWFLVQKL